MARPFEKLRSLMHAHGESQKYVAQILKLTLSTANKRMTGKLDWKLNEMYALMDHYNVPHDRLHEVFPKDGRTDSMR